MILLAALPVLLVLLCASSTASAATYFLSGEGHDHSAGTREAPWQTIARAEHSVRPGDSVCFLPGTYGRRGMRTTLTVAGTPRAPISWRGCSSDKPPDFLGQLRIAAPYNEALGFRFDGPTGPIDGTEEIPVWLNAAGTRVAHSEVSGSKWHAGVFVSGAPGFSIDHDYIHDNGVEYNLDHGIYVSTGSPGRIEENLIADNRAWGINLYPDATGVLMAHNTIVGNGRGGVIVSTASEGNELLNNLIVGNAEYGIRGYQLTASGNRAERNLVWGQEFELEGEGMEFTDNLVVNPRILSLDDPRLLPGSPAIGASVGSTGGTDLDGIPRGTKPDLGALQHRDAEATGTLGLAMAIGKLLGALAAATLGRG